MSAQNIGGDFVNLLYQHLLIFFGENLNQEVYKLTTAMLLRLARYYTHVACTPAKPTVCKMPGGFFKN